MAGDNIVSDLTFLGRDSALARRVGRPINKFLAVQAAGGVLLIIATAIALIWANSPWSDSYESLWHTYLDIKIGDFEIFHESLEHFVNDALMALFFFVVGLEIKRELVTGRLRNPRDAMLPAFGAVGGMVVPALFYIVFNLGEAGARGWGIPMATDIAFAVGVLSLLGDRVPRALKVFLLTLAIVDDIGAIAVIAIFYSEDLSMSWLAGAVAIAIGIAVLRRLRVWYIPVYIVVGVIFWWATYKSGVHATIAGVILGLMTPAKPLQSEAEARKMADWLRDKEEVFLVDVRYASFNIAESVSVAERLETAIHPITSYMIIPIFALANAGVPLSGDIISNAATSPVTIGVIAGLVLGKAIGITAFTLLATKLKIATMPRAMTTMHLVGLALVGGIGFTVSLFITGLAFTGDTAVLVDEAKIGILFGSLIAALGGLAVLSRAKLPSSYNPRTDD